MEELIITLTLIALAVVALWLLADGFAIHRHVLDSEDDTRDWYKSAEAVADREGVERIDLRRLGED